MENDIEIKKEERMILIISKILKKKMINQIKSLNRKANNIDSQINKQVNLSEINNPKKVRP